MMPNTIQPREYSRGGDSDTDGASYILDRNGNPYVFNVERDDHGTLKLNNNWANPDNKWNLDNRIVFRFRNSSIDKPLQIG